MRFRRDPQSARRARFRRTIWKETKQLEKRRQRRAGRNSPQGAGDACNSFVIGLDIVVPTVDPTVDPTVFPKKASGSAAVGAAPPLNVQGAEMPGNEKPCLTTKSRRPWGELACCALDGEMKQSEKSAKRKKCLICIRFSRPVLFPRHDAWKAPEARFTGQCSQFGDRGRSPTLIFLSRRAAWRLLPGLANFEKPARSFNC